MTYVKTNISQNTEMTIQKVRIVTLVGMALNILVATLKGIGGILFNSQALLADAIHSVTDLVTDFAVIFGVKFWTKPPDETHPYGHGKIETIITSFIAIALGLVAFGLCIDAIKSLRLPTPEKPGAITFWIALFSIGSKEILFRWTIFTAKKIGSPGLAANGWHHRSDAISSIPVALVISITQFFPKLGFLDAVGALLVAAFILHAAYSIIKPALLELTDGGGEEIAKSIKQVALKHKNVVEVHNARARRLGSGYQADIHIWVDGNLSVREGHKIAHEVKNDIFLKFKGLGITDIIVHVEPAK